MTLQRFQMIVTEPTYIGGDLRDHVYLGNSFMKKKEASSLMRNIYFSDHDAFKCKIYLKGYLCYKTMTSQNVLSEARVKNFFIS